MSDPAEGTVSTSTASASTVAATEIAVAIVRAGGKLLVGQRPEGSHLAGYWEFPGGKCDPGESPERAAARECLEEIGLAVEVGEVYAPVTFAYAEGAVRLHFFECRLHNPHNAPENLHARFRWIDVVDLIHYRFPPANDAIIRHLVRGASNAS